MLKTCVLVALLASASAFGQSSIVVKSLNSIQMADQFPGVDAGAKLNACIAQVISSGGGTCDARSLLGTQTVSGEVDVGSSSGTAVTLLVPPSGTWSVSITDGVSCAFKVFNNSSIVGTATGGSSGFKVQAMPSASLDSLLCSDPSPVSGGSYVRVEGLQLYNPNGGAIVSAALNAQLLFDNSTFKDVTVANYDGVGVFVHGACCGAAFYNLTTNGGSGPGALPLVIGQSGQNTGAVSFVNLSATHPGAGEPVISINGPSTWTTSLDFYNVYMETTNTDSTPLISLASAEGPFNFWGVKAGAASQSAYIFDIAPGVQAFNVWNVATGATKNAINDHQNSVAVTVSATNKHVPYYGFDDTASYFGPKGVVLESISFGSLGSAANGSVRYCSDCTVNTPASCLNTTTVSACACKSGGGGALAKRISGVWLCN